MNLYQILVPTVRKDGRPIKTRFHKVWDEKIRSITGGLSIYPPIKGQWISDSEELFIERMIPVQIACSHAQIIKIMEFTKKYYEQEKIFAYLISEKVIIK